MAAFHRSWYCFLCAILGCLCFAMTCVYSREEKLGLWQCPNTKKMMIFSSGLFGKTCWARASFPQGIGGRARDAFSVGIPRRTVNNNRLKNSKNKKCFFGRNLHLLNNFSRRKQCCTNTLLSYHLEVRTLTPFSLFGSSIVWVSAIGNRKRIESLVN